MLHKLSILLLSILLSSVLSTSPRCSGSAVYEVTFANFLLPRLFGSRIPTNGLVFSPLAGVSHSNRISILTVRGFASPEIEAIAERGDNTPLIRLARRLRRQGRGIKTIAGADGPTMPGKFTTLKFRVDCKNPFISLVSMIAPSPDWIVQINNFDTVKNGKFIKFAKGPLIAYDAGTDDGDMFTDPADLSKDIPTEPPQNIAPLVEDSTDPFGGRVVGKYIVRRTR